MPEQGCCSSVAMCWKTVVQLLRAGTFLEAQEPHAGHLGQWGEAAQREGTMAVPGMLRIALPGNAHAVARDALQLRTPGGDALGIGRQVGDHRRYGVERG